MPSVCRLCDSSNQRRKNQLLTATRFLNLLDSQRKPVQPHPRNRLASSVLLRRFRSEALCTLYICTSVHRNLQHIFLLLSIPARFRLYPFPLSPTACPPPPQLFHRPTPCLKKIIPSPSLLKALFSLRHSLNAFSSHTCTFRPWPPINVFQTRFSHHQNFHLQQDLSSNRSYTAINLPRAEKRDKCQHKSTLLSSPPHQLNHLVRSFSTTTIIAVGDGGGPFPFLSRLFLSPLVPHTIIIIVIIA